MKKKLLKNFKIYIAGHNGMVGRAVLRHLKNVGVKKIITVSRNNLDLLNLSKLKKFIKNNCPDIIINCAGKVGGIFANSKYPVPLKFPKKRLKLFSGGIATSTRSNLKSFAIHLNRSFIL